MSLRAKVLAAFLFAVAAIAIIAGVARLQLDASEARLARILDVAVAKLVDTEEMQADLLSMEADVAAVLLQSDGAAIDLLVRRLEDTQRRLEASITRIGAAATPAERARLGSFEDSLGTYAAFKTRILSLMRGNPQGRALTLFHGPVGEALLQAKNALAAMAQTEDPSLADRGAMLRLSIAHRLETARSALAEALLPEPA
ncbi:MAG: MCP four helix bundle domain-containing protein, partial [Pseudomonadota bacterium]